MGVVTLCEQASAPNSNEKKNTSSQISFHDFEDFFLLARIFPPLSPFKIGKHTVQTRPIFLYCELFPKKEFRLESVLVLERPLSLLLIFLLHFHYFEMKMNALLCARRDFALDAQKELALSFLTRNQLKVKMDFP